MIVVIVASKTTLAESGDYKFTISFSKNSSNSSNSDVSLGLTVGSTSQPLSNSQLASGVCVNVGTNNYQLGTQSTTLKGFAIEWTCSSACTSLAAVYFGVNFYAGASFGQTTVHVPSAQSSLSAVTSPAGTNDNNSTAKTISHSWAGLTPTQLASIVYFPNQTETWYVRCFGKFNYASSLNYASGITDLTSTVGNGKNLSLNGHGYQAATILAVVGTLVASLT
ncbi:unnamed protein product [Moneuplotes crassus]|uniref:Uncharacterized protein n=1 Tax=Euplotes crassus TaxID=5936 RepID=A0AAD1XNR1_EUPCR|nr:unnamed protein product [Moneuplotes crassus]